MGVCYFCSERERVSYFSYFCDDCAMLRRMLMIYSPDKCTDILKKTCLRDDKQIDFKINQEIKKIINKDIEKVRDDTYADKVTTRSKKI
tara:strand:- start:925 stop:1191 length:267 start_codon:yes stop_codon:yes gene_type:complete